MSSSLPHTSEGEVTGPRLVSPPRLFVRLRVNQRLMTDRVGLDLRKKATDGVQSKAGVMAQPKRWELHTISSAVTLGTFK